MNAYLARLELAILPAARFGVWCQIAAHNQVLSLKHLSPSEKDKLDDIKFIGDKPLDLVNHREHLAATLVWVWAIVSAVGCLLLVFCVLFALRPELY